MSTTFTEIITLVKIECGSCGGLFAIGENFLETKKRESGGWHCPYCGNQRGYWESEAEGIKKLLDEKSRALTAAKCDLLKEQNLRAEAERKLNRTKNGVCPCCNRSFANLMRHMRSKHKDFQQTK